MTFSGQAGTNRSEAGNIVAGFGSSIVRNQKLLTASTTPTGSLASAHFYVFHQTSLVFIRATNRVRRFVTTFRTLE